MTIRDHLNTIRDPKRLPNRPWTGRPTRVSNAYQQTVEVQDAPRTYELASARPGRTPRSATLVSGPTGVVSLAGDRVFYAPQENGTAVLEVIY